MATVDVSFSPLPAHVRTARLIALAVARRVGVAEDMLDEVRLAVGEACSRAVGVHAELATDAPISMRLSDDDQCFAVEVVDVGPLDDDPLEARFDTVDGTVDPSAWDDEAADSVPAGFGLVVIGGIVDELVVTSDAAGTHVKMAWPVPPDPTGQT
ncbi:MAG TPA: ATP-binding protein [Mycobacteriales bacterium]|jgi:anti-sigma regulatory factor (Ser/Thr protein kinase)|nr:ATP-binding protein [Mycobacteriales bacterium]